MNATLTYAQPHPESVCDVTWEGGLYSFTVDGVTQKRFNDYYSAVEKLIFSLDNGHCVQESAEACDISFRSEYEGVYDLKRGGRVEMTLQNRSSAQFHLNRMTSDGLCSENTLSVPVFCALDGNKIRYALTSENLDKIMSRSWSETYVDFKNSQAAADYLRYYLSTGVCQEQ